MFEEELKLERRSSNILPLLLIVGLLTVVVGTVAYTIFEVRAGRKGPAAADASRLAAATLQARRPAVTYFRVGQLKPLQGDQVGEPNYRLLEKAGIVKIKKGKEGAGLVTLTPQGEQTLAAVAGVQKTKNPDGTWSYTVPLGERKLVQVVNVVVERPNIARVEYVWEWAPNAMGDVFDATGPAAMSLTLWDRATLIQKYGADLYHAKPEKEALRVMRTDTGWIIPPA